MSKDEKKGGIKGGKEGGREDVKCYLARTESTGEESGPGALRCGPEGGKQMKTETKVMSDIAEWTQLAIQAF